MERTDGYVCTYECVPFVKVPELYSKFLKKSHQISNLMALI